MTNGQGTIGVQSVATTPQKRRALEFVDAIKNQCPRHATILAVLSCLRCASKLHSQLSRRRELDLMEKTA